MSTVSVTTETILVQFDHFDEIFRSSKGHFFFTRSSLKFWMSYIARYIVNIRSISRLFPGVFLIYTTIASPENHGENSWFEFLAVNILILFINVVLWYMLVMNFLCWFIDEWRMI